MRVKERIPIVLKHLDIKQFIIDLKVFDNNEMIDALINFHTCKETIKEFWLENPDLRLTQVLVNLGLLPNADGFWYHTEESYYLISKGILKFEEINFWGVNYYKNGRKKPKTKFKLLKDLDTDHIRNILKFFGANDNQINTRYLMYFKQRLLEDENSKQEVKNLLKNLE